MKNYRSSNISHYFYCPKAYKLSLEYQKEQSEAMREGLLFEGYVFGKFKEDNEKELIGRKRPDTINLIKQKADLVKPLFIKGEPFRKLLLKTSDYTISGEADYVGTTLFQGKGIECIADLKFTGNMKVWDDLISLARKEDFIQAFIYPYLFYKETGKVLPFIYCVIENNFDNPLIKQIKFNTSIADFKWVSEMIETIHQDDFYYSNANYGTCVSGKYGRCSYLEHCNEGRNFIAGEIEMSLNNLS